MTAFSRHNFWTQPTGWTSGAKNGFLLWPHDEGAEGWGEPFKDKDGNKITPGTLGGPNQNALLGYKKGKYKLTRNANFQAAGNIDWVGPDPVAPDTTRDIVTVNGPLSRYWNFGGTWVYDGNEHAQEVYKDGRVIAVCPYPVLGACLSPGRFTHANGSVENVQWIICVCKDGEGELALAKPLTSYVRADKLGEARVAMVKMADSFSNPKGWVEIGELGKITAGAEAYPQETPWFFDCEGLNGQATKRGKIEFDDGGGNTLTQDVMFLASVSIVHTSAGPKASFYCEGYTAPTFTGETADTAAGIEYKEVITKTHPTYTSPALGAPGGVSHEWQEDHLQVEITLKGTMNVAVDYDPVVKRWLYGTLKCDQTRLHSQYWTKGIDAGGPSPNTGNVLGPVYMKPSPYVPAQGDHFPSVWFGEQSRMILRITDEEGQELIDFYLGYGQSGDRSMKDGLSDLGNPDDPYLAFWDSMEVWLHYCDMRYQLFSGYVHIDQMEINFSTGYEMIGYETIEWAGKAENDPFEDAPGTEKYTRFTSPIANEAYNFGYLRADMETWPDEINETITRKDHNGVWTEANAGAAITEPEFKEFYAETGSYRAAANLCWTRWPINQLLNDRADKNHRSGVFGALPDGKALVYFVYQNENTGEQSTAATMWPSGELEQLIADGNRYMPGGVV